MACGAVGKGCPPSALRLLASRQALRQVLRRSLQQACRVRATPIAPAQNPAKDGCLHCSTQPAGGERAESDLGPESVAVLLGALRQGDQVSILRHGAPLAVTSAT